MTGIVKVAVYNETAIAIHLRIEEKQKENENLSYKEATEILRDVLINHQCHHQKKMLNRHLNAIMHEEGTLASMCANKRETHLTPKVLNGRTVEFYFTKVKPIFLKFLQAKLDPSLFFYNMDETACSNLKDIRQNRIAVIGTKGETYTQALKENMITLCPVISSSSSLGHFFVTSRKTINGRSHMKIKETGAVVIPSDNGWMDEVGLGIALPYVVKWIKEDFKKKLKILSKLYRVDSKIITSEYFIESIVNLGIKPVLFLDQASSHYRFAAGLDNAGIEVVFLPAGTTAYLQPLDLFAFGEYKSKIVNMHGQNMEKRIRHYSDVWNSLKINESNPFWNGFLRAGLIEGKIVELRDDGKSTRRYEEDGEQMQRYPNISVGEDTISLKMLKKQIGGKLNEDGEISFNSKRLKVNLSYPLKKSSYRKLKREQTERQTLKIKEKKKKKEEAEKKRKKKKRKKKVEKEGREIKEKEENKTKSHKK